METSPTARVSLLLTATIALAAVILQLYVAIQNNPFHAQSDWVIAWNVFSYFTIISNCLVAIALFSIILFPSTAAARYFGKATVLAGIAVYIFIVGLTYNAILRSVWDPQGLQRWVDEALHVAVPVLYVSCWLCFAQKRRIGWDYAFRWLLLPGLYLVYALWRGAYTGFHAYPFIDTDKLGFPRVLLNSGIMLVFFVVTGCIVIGISRRLSSGRPI